MIVKEIRDLISRMRGEGTADGDGRFSHADILRLINAREKLIQAGNLNIWAARESLLAVETTTLSAAHTAGGATISVTSAANLGRFRWLWVYDGTNYDRTQIQSISGTTVTILPVLANGYASGSTVVVDNHFLPREVGEIISIREWATDNFLEKKTIYRYDRYRPKPTSSATPEMFILVGKGVDREPSTGTYAADAGTNTTTIVDSQLTAGSDDYYNGWELVNVTRSATARVTDYVASTTTLTLGAAIASQAIGDTYYLIPHMQQFILDPLPDADITLHLRYYAAGGVLVNDYDEPVLPEAFHMLLVWGTLRDLAAGDTGNPIVTTNLGQWEHLYNSMLRDLRDYSPGRPSEAAEETVERESYI